MLTCPFKQMPDPAHETDKKREFFSEITIKKAKDDRIEKCN